MKRVAIAKLACLGVVVVACSAPDRPSLDHGRPTGTGGSTGVGVGSGGSGGGIAPPIGTGGSVGGFGGGSGGFAGAGGKFGAPDAGPYTEAVVEAEDPPPPIAGGTLAIVGQGHRAAVSDPDNDQVVVVDIDAMTIVSTTPLQRGDEPGRLVEDGDGRLHVALRSGRAVAVIDPVAGTVLGRLPVCGHPRGVAYDAAANAVHVACAGGELVSYVAASGAPLRKVRLERDLRDIVVDGNRLLVSRFRAAEILVVESNGTVSSKLRPPAPPPAPGFPTPRLAAVAWRTIASTDGGALMVYQSLGVSSVPTTPGGYGGTCGGIITTSVSVLRIDGTDATVDNVPAVLPVDIATTSPRRVAVASAAWTPGGSNPSLPPYTLIDMPVPGTGHPRVSLGCRGGGPPPPVLQDPNLVGDLQTPQEPATPDVDAGPPSPPPPTTPPPPPPTDASTFPGVPQGRVVAIGFGPLQQLILQTREPATLMVGGRTIALPGRSRKHTGHELFHLGTLGGLACASCHPEGHEDGQVWNFAGLGPRRTQPINGGIRGTEPFHWSGDMSSFAVLAHDVFNSRMTGPNLTDDHVNSLFRWIDTIPLMAPPAAEDPAAVERGRALFNDADVACATCHSGEKFTNNATVAVNTGGGFQVPSLRGLAWRAPYLHNGGAPTLADRFGTAGGGDMHGHTSALSQEQIADLVAYLETL